MSENKDFSNMNQNMQQMTTQWAELIGQLFDRLTGKGASVTYTFDNLVIDMPKAQGPSGQDARPTFSRMMTGSGDIQVTSLRELNKLKDNFKID